MRHITCAILIKAMLRPTYGRCLCVVQAHLHVQMRRQADNMLRELDQARVHPGTQQRTAATRTPVRLASRAKVDSLGIEFTTPLPVKLSFAAAV